MLSTVVIDALIKQCDAYTYLERLGYIMIGSTCIPYALAMVCFYYAGKHYVQFKTCMQYCKSTTLEKINIEDFMEAKVVRRKTFTVFVSRNHKQQSFVKEVSNSPLLRPSRPTF